MEKITKLELDQLVRQEPKELAQSSPKSYERDTVIARWMDLICQQTMTEVSSEELARYWFEALKSYPVNAINYAFDCYMKHGADEHGRFFRPAPAQIVRLCEQWMESQATKSSGTVEEMDALKQREASGEQFYSLADAAVEFKKLMREKGIL